MKDVEGKTETPAEVAAEGPDEEETARIAPLSEDIVYRRRRLIAALRSGHFRQVGMTLTGRDDAGQVAHCCLGVACEVAIADGLGLMRQRGSSTPDQPGRIIYCSVDNPADSSQSLLPSAVGQWYGFASDNPILHIPNEVLGELDGELSGSVKGGRTYAGELNDSVRANFNQIADCFEYTYLPEDWEETLEHRAR